MTSLAEQYRAERRAQSGSMIYQPAPEATPKVNLYADSQTYQGLGGYASATPRSKFAQASGESDHAFTSRLQGIGLVHLADALDEDTLATISEQYNAAVTRLEGGETHADLRQRLASRTTGTGIGIMGGNAEQRAQAVGSRFGGRELAGEGHLSHYAGALPGQPSLSILSRLPREDNPLIARRQETAELRSSGAGFLGVDHG
jgi:hypothetical protein